VSLREGVTVDVYPGLRVSDRIVRYVRLLFTVLVACLASGRVSSVVIGHETADSTLHPNLLDFAF
jgi:hypothetical protein